MSGARVSSHPVVNQKLTRLRAQDTGPAEFRTLVGDLALLLGVEATADLPATPMTVETPLGPCQGSALKPSISLVPLLRAGLGMTEALSRLLPDSDIRHLGYTRNPETLQPEVYYAPTPPDPAPDLALILDPMLATGGSACDAIQTVKDWGVGEIRFLGILGAPEGVAALASAHPDVAVHLCGLDERLNEKGYILPGLGDAGDRQFAT